MATIQKSARKGNIAPDKPVIAQAETIVKPDDAERQSGTESVAERKHVAKDWSEIDGILKALEKDGCPVCQVYVSEPKQELWHGLFGNAKVYKGDNYAVLSNGNRVPL